MLAIAAASCTALGQRERNEDRLRVSCDGARWLFALADGAGGHQGGEQAAIDVVERFELALHVGDGDFGAQALTGAVLAAHVHLRGAQAEAQGAARMHATLVALWIDVERDRALWSHVGDSRLYRVRHGELERLTDDDSVVQRMLEAGMLSAQQAEAHPQRNQLIAALGVDDEVEPHTCDAPVPLREGDAFLLCSDGWWGSIGREAIVAALADAATPDEWLGAMRDGIEALRRVRQDNFSAIAVWVGDVAEMTRPMIGPQ